VDDRGPFLRPMFFLTEKGAASVLKAIVKVKALAHLFEWRVVLLEGIDS